MSEATLYAAIAAAFVATFGLWWFRLILKNVRNQPKVTRYGIYALVWLAYFILTLMVIGQPGASGH